MSIIFMEGFEQYPSGADANCPYGFGQNQVLSGPGWGRENGACGRGNSGFSMPIDVPAAAEYWFGAAWALGDNAHMLQVWEGGTAHIFAYRLPSGRIRLLLGGDTGGFIADTDAGMPLTGSTYHYVEFHIKIGNADGEIHVMIDGEEALALTGIDTRNGGAVGVIDKIEFRAYNNGRIDDVYIDDAEFNGDIRILWCDADAAGALQEGTASAGTLLSCVDDAHPNGDTDYVAVDDTTLPNTVTFGFEALPGGIGAIKGVQVEAHVKKSAAGTCEANVVLVSGSSEDEGATVVLTESYQRIYKATSINPDTAAAWNATAVNAIEGGVRRTA